MDENGNKFWSGSKLVPHPITHDLSNPLHYQFIFCAASLHAQSLGIDFTLSSEAIRQISSSIQFPPYEYHTSSDNMKVIAQMISELPARETLKE